MKVGVVGCGIGGMAAALALARRGHEVTIFETFPEPKPVGSGLLLQPTGLKALEALGLADAVRACGSPVERLFGRDAASRIVMDVNYAHWRAGTHGVGIHRAVLFSTLYEAVRAQGIEVRTASAIGRIEEPHTPVLIDERGLAHGPFDLAIIANGCGSNLRGQLNARARAPQNVWGAVWANAVDHDQRFRRELAQVYDGAHVMIGVLPIGQGPDGARDLVSLFWSLPVAEMDAFFTGDIEAWKRRVIGYWPQTAPLLDQIASHADLSRATYRDVSAGRWSHGACTLLGDAAHGTSPQLGQGANLALVDAVELAQALGPASVARSLRRYQASRRRHTGLYQLASRLLTPLFQAHGRFWPTMRRWFFTPLSQAPGFRRLGAATLTGALRLGRWPEVTRP